MRNLRNVKHTKFKLDGATKTVLSATTWDASDDSLVLAFGPAEDSPTITLKRLSGDATDFSGALAIASWDAPSPNPDLPVDRIVDLHCFPDTKTITLILEGGDIVVVREDHLHDQELIEIVGSIDAGIRAAAWSPDEELLAISTGADTVLFMTREFDGIADIALSAEDLKVSAHVSVGWGKRETQFKGRGAAKALRDPTMPEHVDEGALSTLDDGSTMISWRGDGQCVAINSILDVEPKRRVIRMYSREGELESVSEPINGLEGALSWKPSGQLIAGIQRNDDRIDVVFFERNGLRHGDFSLRLEPEEMETIGRNISLTWNVDSSVLAVSFQDRVQLWTMGNYHYYLKQEIILSAKASAASIRAVWHPEKPLRLLCNNDCDVRRLHYRFDICRGPVDSPHDTGLVAVIDGKTLRLTPFRTANIPPPMAFDEFHLSENASDVAINDTGTEIVVLHQGAVTVLRCNYLEKPPKTAQLKATLDRLSLEYGSWRSSGAKSQGAKDSHIRTDHDRIWYQATEDHSDSHGSASREDSETIWTSPAGDKTIFRLSDGGLLVIQSDFETVRISGCTSFVLTKVHLIYTTSQHLLKFIHLQSGKLEVPADEPEKDERCRSIERGARIVTVMPSAYSLVLQMPRGNLETIYPRALVLAGIRDTLQKRDYKKAFLACRTHRVDMNILHDYAPHTFLNDIELFVEQVRKTEFLDLFLSSLSDEDVSTTMYKNTLPPTAPMGNRQEEEALPNGLAIGISHGADHELPNGISKVNRICDAFLIALRQNNSSRLQNIVTAHVCKNPPDLEAGIRLISELRKESDQERLEQAVEHICFLADVNKLYDTALGVYDLDVALLIAQQSQKDPREYLPYLQELNDLQTLRRQFKIDDDLKRYEKALNHLHALQAFDEIKSYASKHELYAMAIDLYRYDNTRLCDLMRLHADFLNSSNKFKEAAIAYEYIADYVSAYEAYRAISLWRECLTNAGLVPLSKAELYSLAEDLAASVEEGKDFQGAALIHLDYLNDLEGSARLLCKGYQFAEASRQVTLRQRPDLLKTVVDLGLIEASATVTELLAEMKTQLGAQVPRLRELRQKKAEDPMAFLDGADGGDGDVPDNISLAPTDASTSGGTFMTRYTNRSDGTLATNATRKTSKNRRREERKRARGKKGTVYEEEYLVNSIARLVHRLNDVVEDVTKLIEGLIRRGMRERAIAVQAAMDEVDAAVRSCMAEVFQSNDQHTESQQEGDVQASRPWGGEGVLWDALTSQRQEAPTLKRFERLALLP